MIKYYTSSIYRKHYSDLEKLNLLDESLQIEPYDLSSHVLKKSKQTVISASKSPKKSMQKSNIVTDPQTYFTQLIDDLEVFKNLTLSPIKIFKSLMLVHCCFLLIKTAPNDQNNDKLNDYLKWIFHQTEKLIDKFNTKQQKKKNSFFGKSGDSLPKNKDKNKQGILREFKSTRELSPAKQNNTARPKSTGKYSTQGILTKQLCLLSSIIKPYILYLQKILSIYSHYQSLLHSIPSTIEQSQQSTWTILNILKLQAPIIKTFSYVGRYFYKQYSPIVYFLIEFFSKEIYRIYPKIYAEAKKKIQVVAHQWFVLLQKYSQYQIFSDQNIQIQGAQNALLLIDEIAKINDTLYHIYFGKYFYQVVLKLKLPQPKWFEINSKDCQFLIHYHEVKFKKGRRQSRASSKQKKLSNLSTQKRISLPLNSQIVSENNNILKCESVNHQIIVIEKKNLIPKVKNSLKLCNQKQNKQKQDTITFRVKQFIKPMDQSKTLGDQSFRQDLQKNSNVQTIRTRISRTRGAQVFQQ